MFGCHDAAGLLSCLVFAMAGENCLLAGKAGAIDAVVAAMRAHVSHAGVLEFACKAMQNICFDNGTLGIGCVCVCVCVLCDCW